MNSTNKKTTPNSSPKLGFHKWILTSICFCLMGLYGFSQDSLQVPEPNLDTMLRGIDKTAFTSGILYDRVMPIAGLSNFNTPEQNVSNKNHFEQALHELHRASEGQKFTSYKALRKKYVASDHEVNIGILNTVFQTLNYNPINKSEGALLLKNNTFVKKNDKAR